MADISIIHNGNTDYNVKDAAGREALAVVENKGAKNRFDFSNWANECVVVDGSKTFDGSIIRITASQSSACYTKYESDYPTNVDISVTEGERLELSWSYQRASGSGRGSVYAYCMDGTTVVSTVNAQGTVGRLSVTVPSGATILRISIQVPANTSEKYSKMMICTTAEWDVSQAYAPYGKTNAELTVENASQQSEINYAVNAGAKSLLPIGVSSITYYSAVTFSVADDGQITVNGTNPNTNNGIAYQDIVTAKTSQTETRYTLPVGRYKITETGTNGLRFQVHCHDGTNTHELHSSSSSGEFNYTESLKSQYPYICWRILIVAKSSFSNHVVKPMIWDAAITDPTFQPYARTNRDLTVLTDEDRASLVELVDNGYKSIFDCKSDSKTVNTVSFTNNGDNTFTVNGTNNGTTEKNVYTDIITNQTSMYDTRYSLPVGSYHIIGTGVEKLAFQVYSHNGSDQYTQLIQTSGIYETGADFIVDGSLPYIAVRLTMFKGGSYANKKIKFMICTSAAWKISQEFQPYAPTNRELYETKITGEDVYGLGVELSSGTDLNNITKVGRYICTGAGVGNTLVNCPTIQPFVLTVSTFQANGNIIHRIESLNLSTFAVEIFERMKISSGWKSWYKFEGTAVT